MNEIAVRRVVEAPFHSGAGIYLRINGVEEVKLSFDISDYARIRGDFDLVAAEFAYFCAVIYGCDRAVSRDIGEGDRWTRELSVVIPVADPGRWETARGTAERMLEFLTGDLWRLSFVNEEMPLFGVKFRKTRRHFHLRKRAIGTAVSLFSGGLDSLVGVVDWLERNPTEALTLASSYDHHAENANDDQQRLLPKIKEAYPGRISHFVARSGLLSKGEDGNFRSRSLMFLGNAVLGASFVGAGARIWIPENGAIGLNFPISPARSGSLSTRTVHPFFIQQFNALLQELGFGHSVENIYDFKTKGEVVSGCLNQDILRALYKHSVSCGKRGRKMHWNDRFARACGHCVPCIFRQAAVYRAGLAPEDYGCTVSDRDKWGNSDLLRPNGDLQTVIDFVRGGHDEEIIWLKLRANGRLDRNFKSDYVDLILRLRAELRNWLRSMKLV